jgi:carbonic anhydrase
MSAKYLEVFENNKKWICEKTALNPRYFVDLVKEQTPEFQFIGCSDSRVLANEITGLETGELFVHRNIANQVVGTDLNVQSVIDYHQSTGREIHHRMWSLWLRWYQSRHAT